MTEPLHVSMGPGREFDLVRRLEATWGALAVGLGDDAAVLTVPPGEHLVVSTDTSVEDVHFRRGWLTPEEIGYRATQAALSDLAAMGARPLGVLLGLSLPSADVFCLDEIARGVGTAVQQAGTVIRGGDLTAGQTLSLCITVLGSAAHPLTRAGARPGMGLYVTGMLGGPGAAVRAWSGGGAPDPWSRSRFASPRARIAEGLWLTAHGAAAAIDISDGLAPELRHMAAASGVRLRVDEARIPRPPGVEAADALASGEEYELLCAAEHLDAAQFSERFGIPLTRIGVVEDGPSEVVLTRAGVRVDPPRGHDHFSS